MRPDMPKLRWIVWQGKQWRLTELAVTHHMLPQTLAARLARGYPIERALATGLCSLDEAGRRGSRSGTWRNP